MRRVLATMAMLAVVATPAFAQDNSGGIGQITHPQDKYYNQDGSYNQNYYNQGGASFSQRDAAHVYARAFPGTHRRASRNVYDSQRHVIGADPDPNVRLQMRMDENNFDE